MSKFVYKIIIAVMILLVTTTTPLMAQAPIEVRPKVLSAKEALQKYATIYNVSYEKMYRTAFCESSLNPNAINNTPREYSVGIVQINLKAHTHITVAQAKDVEFASEFMAKEFSRGNARIWSCYTKIYGV